MNFGGGSNWGCCKIEDMDISRNNLIRLTNHNVSIERKEKKIIVIAQAIIRKLPGWPLGN